VADAASPSRAGTKDAANASRSSTKLSVASGTKSGASSRASSTLTTPEQKNERDLKKRLDALPPFLKQERDRLFQEAKKLGYEDFQINRAFRGGVPAATIEALADNIVFSGYGKSPTYKEAAEAAIPDPSDLGLAVLPGQPDSTMYSTRSSADFNFVSFFGSNISSGRDSPMPLLSMVDFTTTPIQSPMGTKERFASNSRFSTKDGPSSVTSYGPGVARSLTNLSSFTGDESMMEPPGRRKSILKSKSRETSKDLVGMDTAWSARHFSSTKESVASTCSLRSTALVRFADQTPHNSCGICFEAEVTVEFRPCGHQLACASCAAKLRGSSVCCPLCQGIIQDVIPLQPAF